MSHQTDQQNAIEAVRQQNRREGKCEDCGGSGVVANMRAIDQTGDPHVNRRCARCGGSGLPVVTATSGTCDRSMASGAMLSPPDDLASLRAQVQALQQERDELYERNKTLSQEAANHIGRLRLHMEEVVLARRERDQRHELQLKAEARAEAADAEIASLKRALAVECTCRVIEMCARCEAVDAVLAALTSAPEGTT